MEFIPVDASRANIVAIPGDETTRFQTRHDGQWEIRTKTFDLRTNAIDYPLQVGVADPRTTALINYHDEEWSIVEIQNKADGMVSLIGVRERLIKKHNPGHIIPRF